MPEQFFHFLISPFSKERHRGICFYFSSFQCWKEREENYIQNDSCILSSSPLSLPIKRANHCPQVSPWQAAHSIFLWKIRKCLNLLTTWVGFLAVQKQSGALGLRGNLCT